MTDKLDDLLNTGKGSFSKVIGNLYEFYLSGEIEEASEYTEWFDTIRNARSTAGCSNQELLKMVLKCSRTHTALSLL